MGSKRISNYTSKPSSCLIYVCCHGGLLIALNLASNFGRAIFGWVGPVLASKTSPAGPNYVDQTWSGRTDFSPDQFFRYRSPEGYWVSVWQLLNKTYIDTALTDAPLNLFLSFTIPCTNLFIAGASRGLPAEGYLPKVILPLIFG